jgi:uncharacterized damage-inducible protein DinB
LVHLFQADSIWLDRLEGRQNRPREQYTAPGCTYDLGDAWLKVIDRMIQQAEDLGENLWDRTIAYKLLSGMPMESAYWQIILHVVNHGTHHRGQVSHMLRQLGEKPANMDLIAFYRTQPAMPFAGAFAGGPGSES